MASSGLVFLGYPLHPPGKPERIRDAHLVNIAVPMLFLQGTRDLFALPDLLHQTVKTQHAAKLVQIQNDDWDLALGARLVVVIGRIDRGHLLPESSGFPRMLRRPTPAARSHLTSIGSQKSFARRIGG